MKLIQLGIEREAIKRENDTPKIAMLDKEIAELKEQESSFKAKWQSEKTLVNKIQQDKQEMEKMKFDAERAEREGNYQRVAEIHDGKLQELQKDIDDIQIQLKATQGGSAMIREEVTSDDIAEVVSRWTGIPVTRMLQSEREKLLHLEEELHKRVIGQEEAITAVCDAVRRSRAGLQDPNRPIASFIFLGTTGVGKTELAKALAEYLFSDEKMMTRIDMSEYQEKFSVSRLIGAPPGYVGYDEGGQLTEAVRRKPYSVILFDEIEKAHPDVFNIMLKIFDDGRLTDSKGRTVDFKNTLIIMTSNIGSDIILENTLNAMLSPEEYNDTKDKVMEVLRSRFKPEFLNRIDETIFFKALNLQQLSKIVDIQMDYLRKLLKDQELEFVITYEAKEFLATQGFNPVYGARPLKRVICQMVENPLSKMILAQKFLKGDKIKIDLKDDKLTFDKVSD